MEFTATEKRKALKAMMLQPVCHVAPSCNDGIQARLVEWLGFPLIHISGSGQHRSLGFADAGLLTLTEMINKAREIVDAVNIPVVSDAETGYGNAVNVARAVKEFDRSGVAGIHIEDQVYPKRASYHKGLEHIVPMQEFVERMTYALQARRDPDFLIIGRTDAFSAVEGSREELVRRGLILKE